MYQVEKRVERFAKEIKNLVIKKSEKIQNIKIRRGEIAKHVDPYTITDNWQVYPEGSCWCDYCTGEFALFRMKVSLDEGYFNEKVVLSVRTNKTGWNSLNPQMLVYVNGVEHQGLDTFHTDILLDNGITEKKEYDIMIYACSGFNRQYNTIPGSDEVRFFADLHVIDAKAEDFYYNLFVPYQAAMGMPEGNYDRIRIFSILNDAINLVDLRVPYSKVFYSSLESANDCLLQRLYGEGSNDAIMTCIAHSHIDVAWLWRYCHTREKAVRTFTTALNLMEQYPDYRFMSSQPQLYQFLKEDYPDVYERIKERVKEGRLEAEGGMWVEPDTNVPSGESLVRQFLMGKRFFAEEFGIENRVLWLPDVFGYSAALPQIMKKSGIEYFMTAKLRNNEFNKFPYHTFLWRGIDGTEVLSQILSYCPSVYNNLPEKGDVLKAWDDYAQKEINNDILYTFGYGDGGGGPTKEMVETLRRYEKGIPGAPTVKLGKVADYFDSLSERVKDNPRLPKWVGELYFEFHRGTYTSMARNKRFNRQSEFLYINAEWANSVAALLLGADYPEAELHDGWRDILLNQFHDVLPGSSIKEVYDDTDKMYAKIFENGNHMLEDGLDKVCHAIQSEGESLVVFNPLSWERKGLVSFTYPSSDNEICLADDKGNSFACQKSSESNNHIALIEGIPSKGYSTMKICKKPNKQVSDVLVSESVLENKYFRVTMDQCGCFTSVYDKSAGREVLKPGQKGNVLEAFEDKPNHEDNWNLDIFYSEKKWQVDDVQSVEVLESGPVRGIIRVTRKFTDSSIVQDIMIYKDIPRIDFKTVIDWKEKDIVLKAAFPVDVNAEKATYEIQFGALERNTHWNTTWDVAKFEVCGHKWADLSESGYGVSLLNDCKYGYDIKDGNLRLTLLRCGTNPNPYADKERHEFTYSLYPHTGDWREAHTVRQAFDLNCPMIGKIISQQEGILSSSFSMVSLDSENIILETVKKAEDSDETVFRVYEAHNQRGRVTATFGKNIRRAVLCDLMEREEQELVFDKNKLVFDIKPFEIQTIKVKWCK